ARIYDEDPMERIKPWVLLLIVLTIVALGVMGAIAMQSSGSIVPLMSAIGAMGVVIFALMYWITKHSPRKRVRTWLALALAPLEPTHEEIMRARKEMQASRIKAGYAIRSEKVLAKIKKYRASSM